MADSKSKNLLRFTIRTLLGVTAICAVGLGAVRVIGGPWLVWSSVLGIFWGAGFATAWVSRGKSERSRAWLVPPVIAMNVVNWGLWYVNHLALWMMKTGLEDQDRYGTFAAEWLFRCNERHLFEAFALAITCAVCLSALKASHTMMQVSAMTGLLLWLVFMGFGFVASSTNLMVVP